MKTEKTSDAVAILQKMLDSDYELQALYDEELQKLNLSDKIRNARIAEGISQSELAKRINTSQSVISRIENSSYDRFSLSTVVKVAVALGYNIQMNLVPHKG